MGQPHTRTYVFSFFFPLSPCRRSVPPSPPRCSACLRTQTHGETPTKQNGNNAVQAISSSKDALVKVWDLQTQHCVQTLTGHRYDARTPFVFA